jgi:UPF0271 protein
VHIDLNSDVGEGFGVWSGGPDAELMHLITSANVACGAHAGDPTIMRRTCQLAVQHHVSIGAQVGYADLAGFGRRFIDIEPADLSNLVLYQVGALHAIARAAGAEVRYVKPHGMLYNTVVHHEAQAAAVVAALAELGDGLAVLGLPDGALRRAADRRGVRYVSEGFADRRYQADGTLVPRHQPQSVLTERREIEAQVLRLASSGVATLCVHSDSPKAVDIARWARSTLADTGYDLAPFT